jgi:Trk K+ transport system NAD-binding subunit
MLADRIRFCSKTGSKTGAHDAYSTRSGLRSPASRSMKSCRYVPFVMTRRLPWEVSASQASAMDKPEMLIWPPLVRTTGRSGTSAAAWATWSGSDSANHPVATTTGFGDIHLRNAPPPLQLYGVALMLSGTAALAILFALITDALISARLARLVGAAIPRGLHDHVVVCGLGNIGYRIVEQLHDLGVPVVAAELQETNRYLPAVRRLGVPVLVADIRLPETLQALHVDRARSVVVVTSSDIVNLETALNVQALNPEVRVVQRLFDPDLAARVERAFGIPISRSPSALAAPSFAAAAAGEHVLTTIAVGAEVLAMARLHVEPGCQALGRTVAELEAATGSRVLLLDDGRGLTWHPDGGSYLDGGGELVAVVPRGELGRVLAWTEIGVQADRNGFSALEGTVHERNSAAHRASERFGP